MKKILKYLKQNVVGFVIGGIAFGSFGVFAATVISANSILYTDNSSLGADNVQTAIDKLNTKATTKIKEAKEECPSGNICTKTWAKLGDYVKMSPTSTSYTITTAMTGYSSNQIINPSELNLWRVININSDGTMDLVSEYVSSSSIYFSGKIGYQNYITSLNQIASQYTNSKYTIASRHMGYNGQTGTITDTSALDSTTAPWTSSTSSSTISSNEARGAGDNGYQKDYTLVKNTLKTVVAKKTGTTIETSYWLASRHFVYASLTFWDISGKIIASNGNVDVNTLYRYLNDSSYIFSFSNSIRPIITIKSGLSPTGSGTSTSPYILN